MIQEKSVCPSLGTEAPVRDYAVAHRMRFVAELAELVRFPTINAQPRHVQDMLACARWLTQHLADIGLKHAHLIRTPRHPLVYADWFAGPGRPTVLVYGHYDVQPVEPLDAWTHPPFHPVLSRGNLYGRGASDDKGQFFAHLKAVESYLRTAGALPVNLKVLLDGEEEIGRESLFAFIEHHGPLLAADTVVISDMAIPAPDRPAVTVSLRGMLGLEVEVRGPAFDLHSGTFGGAIHNPIQALCEIVASLHDANGRVTVPGFHDSVRQISPSARSYMSQIGPSDADILRNAGVTQGWGKRGYSAYERTTIRPSLAINGIIGGYIESGLKSVIPARASAKFSFRLVPDQDPTEIDRRFRDHLARIMPPSVRCLVRRVSAARPVVVDQQDGLMNAAKTAYEIGFGKEAGYVRSGGTIPVVSVLQHLLGIPPVLMGFGLPDDSIHGPNEKFSLSNFQNAVRTSICFLAELGRNYSEAHHSKPRTEP